MISIRHVSKWSRTKIHLITRSEAVISTGMNQKKNIPDRFSEQIVSVLHGDADQKELDHLLQCYAVEKARIEARKKGHTCTESQLADGSIKLTIAVAGGVI